VAVDAVSVDAVAADGRGWAGTAISRLVPDKCLSQLMLLYCKRQKLKHVKQVQQVLNNINTKSQKCETS